jgi:restriction system protein
MKKGGNEFIRWMPGILNALRLMGGSGAARDVIRSVASLENVSAEAQVVKNKGGALRFYNQVAWARQYLLWEELLASTKRGVWTLTEKGRNTNLSAITSRELFLKWVKIHAQNRPKTKEENDEPKSKNAEKNTVEELPSLNSDAFKLQHREALIDLLQNLSPEGFEIFCRDLMLEMGLRDVIRVGGTGDDGIDGHGLLELNPVVTLRVAYQCKKYSAGVSISHIKEFQSSIRGKFDKGILFSTGYFTAPAEKAASEAGKEFIELIDGERLMDLLEKMEFGLTPKTVFDINYSFFEKYKAKLSNEA